MELVVLCGIQASGKSTFCRALFADTHKIVSKDLISRRSKHRELRQNEMIHEALRAGYNVVVDNTNPTPEIRAVLVNIARDYGAVVHAYYMESRLRDCLERNERRVGKACVPSVALMVVARKMTPPTPEEGFDRIHIVRLDNNGFAVKKIYPED